jgi:hypothetical protein
VLSSLSYCRAHTTSESSTISAHTSLPLMGGRAEHRAQSFTCTHVHVRYVDKRTFCAKERKPEQRHHSWSSRCLNREWAGGHSQAHSAASSTMSRQCLQRQQQQQWWREALLHPPREIAPRRPYSSAFCAHLSGQRVPCVRACTVSGGEQDTAHISQNSARKPNAVSE